MLHPYSSQLIHFIGRNSMTKNSTFRKTKLSTLSNTFKKLLRKQLELNNSIITYKKFMQFFPWSMDLLTGNTTPKIEYP